MSKPPHAATTSRLEGPSSVGFWAAYGLGWLVLFGLYTTGAWASGAETYVVFGAFANVGPRAVTGLPLAYWRRSLFRPEWSLSRTVLFQSLLGAGFVLVSATLATLLILSFEGWADTTDEAFTFARIIIVESLLSLLIYVLLGGFLMWSESIAQVQASRQLAAREAVLRAEAELKVLRSQFNPHFVFNTLHSLMQLVRAEPGRAERAIEDVAGMIRYASVLQREGVDVVPLSEELKTAMRYVALEKLRLEDRLEVQWAVEPDVVGYSVPVYALQTLLENAIRHGIAPKPEGGTVRVQARVEDGKLTLRIQDDGVGAEVQAVAAAEGHGISLLTQRLWALYGEAANLHYETVPGGGFDVRVRVPLDTPSSKGDGPPK